MIHVVRNSNWRSLHCCMRSHARPRTSCSFFCNKSTPFTHTSVQQQRSSFRSACPAKHSHKFPPMRKEHFTLFTYSYCCHLDHGGTQTLTRLIPAKSSGRRCFHAIIIYSSYFQKKLCKFTLFVVSSKS